MDRPELKRPASPGTTANPLSWLTPSSPAEDGTPLARPRRAAGLYAPRSPAETVLHQVVRTHLERFLAETAAATDGVGVPRFIEREFRDFLGCGALDRGFARVRCDGCRLERLVPFSSKARAVCPSCGGPAHGRAGGASGRCRSALSPRTSVGADRAASTALPPGVRPCTLPRRAGRVHPHGSRLVPAAWPAGRHPALGRSEGSRDARRSGNWTYAIENVVRFAK